MTPMTWAVIAVFVAVALMILLLRNNMKFKVQQREQEFAVNDATRPLQEQIKRLQTDVIALDDALNTTLVKLADAESEITALENDLEAHKQAAKEAYANQPRIEPKQSPSEMGQ